MMAPDARVQGNGKALFDKYSTEISDPDTSSRQISINDLHEAPAAKQFEKHPLEYRKLFREKISPNFSFSDSFNYAWI